MPTKEWNTYLLPEELSGQTQHKVGFVRANAEIDLEKIAKSIQVLSGTDLHLSQDHAIPSPAAHAMHYIKLIKNYDNLIVTAATLGQEDSWALYEWRGMMTLLALRDYLSEKPSVQTFDFSSLLGMVVLESFKESCGWPEGANSFTVFYYKDIPFAILVPEIGICPFKSYPANLFDGISWYRYDHVENKGMWLDPVTVLDPGFTFTKALGVTAKKLFLWLELQRKNGVKAGVEKFKADLLRGLNEDTAIPVDQRSAFESRTRQNMTPEEKRLETDAERSAAALGLGAIMKIAPPPEELPPGPIFSDAALVYVDSGDFSPIALCYMPDNVFENRFSRIKSKLYVIPPVSREFVAFLESYTGDKSGLCRCELLPEPENDLVNFHIKCTLTVPVGGELMSFSRVYPTNEIYWTAKLPQISLWPNVNLPPEMWKSYYVSAVETVKPFGGEAVLDPLVRASHEIGKGGLEFSVWARGNSPVKAYTAKTHMHDARLTGEFRVFHSLRIADAIGLSRGNSDGTVTSFGHLIIRHDSEMYKSEQPNAVFDRDMRVGIDFGTTSTNCYIAPRRGGESGLSQYTEKSGPVDSPDKYFLPVVVDDTEQYEEQRRLYLNTDQKDKISKFFSFGQLFEVRDDKGKPVTGGETVHVFGRAFFSNSVIWSRALDFVAQLDGGDPASVDIYDRLKFSDDFDTLSQTRAVAARLFLSDVLENALLCARMNNARKVTVYHSYPYAEQHEGFQDSWDKVFRYLSEVSGMQLGVNLEHRATTEAAAAGEYFKSKNSVGHAGYLLVDIGGGTTDISAWDKGGEPSPEMRGQWSVRFAGEVLVRRTFAQFVRGDMDFRDLWTANHVLESGFPVEVYEAAVNKLITYRCKWAENVTVPLGTVLSGDSSDYVNSSGALDMLLEKCDINYNVLEMKTRYGRFVGALRIKYLALFYLVARYLKKLEDERKITVGDEVFNVCLAGCGSFGLKLCLCQNSLKNFSDTVFGKIAVGMFKRILGKGDDFNLLIHQPESGQKEEVVTGLADYVNPPDGLAGSAGVGVPPETAAKAVDGSNADIKNAYEVLLSTLKKAADAVKPNEFSLYLSEPVSMLERLAWDRMESTRSNQLIQDAKTALTRFNAADCVKDECIAAILLESRLNALTAEN
ncbi:MAG: hypothetical protein LBQ48_02465 [Oscillospiraceae bacterium]|nr:hypothetical protein [Oscillospiraceae bacterium]